MELVTINDKTEYITSFDNAMELVENACGRELARCIQDIHQQALEEQEENNPNIYTQDEYDLQGEHYTNKLRDITQDVEELQEYIENTKRLDRSKILKFLKGIHDISYDY